MTERLQKILDIMSECGPFAGPSRQQITELRDAVKGALVQAELTGRMREIDRMVGDLTSHGTDVLHDLRDDASTFRRDGERPVLHAEQQAMVDDLRAGKLGTEVFLAGCRKESDPAGTCGVLRVSLLPDKEISYTWMTGEEYDEFLDMLADEVTDWANR